MEQGVVFAISMSLICGAFAALFLWMWFKSKNEVEAARKHDGVFYDNIFKDAWAQHKDKFYMCLFIIFAIGVAAAITVPYMV